MDFDSFRQIHTFPLRTAWESSFFFFPALTWLWNLLVSLPFPVSKSTNGALKLILRLPTKETEKCRLFMFCALRTSRNDDDSTHLTISASAGAQNSITTAVQSAGGNSAACVCFVVVVVVEFSDREKWTRTLLVLCLFLRNLLSHNDILTIGSVLFDILGIALRSCCSICRCLSRRLFPRCSRSGLFVACRLFVFHCFCFTLALHRRRHAAAEFALSAFGCGFIFTL